MKRRFALVMAVGFLVIPCAAASAQTPTTCQPVSGKFNELILPQAAAPNDPLGRILGTMDGSLEGATTAFLTSLAPILNGGLHVTSYNSFATLAGNTLFTIGAADWAFIKSGYYQVSLTLSIVGGTGTYAGAVGTINALGVGNNVGPGTGQFLYEYRGQVCTPVH